MTAIFLCTVSSCLYYPSSESGSTRSFRYAHAGEKYSEWCNDFSRHIIPRIYAYYQLHPERFKPTGHGEEIAIDGFAAFVKDDDYFKKGYRSSVVKDDDGNFRKGYRRSVWSGTIRDPWGEPVHFVQDLNMDGYIEAGGERRNVQERRIKSDVQLTNKGSHFGVLKQSPFKGPYGKPWERIIAE